MLLSGTIGALACLPGARQAAMRRQGCRRLPGARQASPSAEQVLSLVCHGCCGCVQLLGAPPEGPCARVAFASVARRRANGLPLVQPKEHYCSVPIAALHVPGEPRGPHAVPCWRPLPRAPRSPNWGIGPAAHADTHAESPLWLQPEPELAHSTEPPLPAPPRSGLPPSPHHIQGAGNHGQRR